MKQFKFLVKVSFVLVVMSGFSQQKTQEQIERELNKVNLFTSEEKDNLQSFYAEEVDKMKLSEEKRDEYYNTLLFYTHSMSRLDDKDKQYSEIEILKKFKDLQSRMNEKMKKLLTQEQYVIHLEAFSSILYSVSRRTSVFKQKK